MAWYPETVTFIKKKAPKLHDQLESFFASASELLEKAEKRQHHIDKRQATAFNVFDLIEPKENKLSDILADMLDPKGDHGQGELFLRLLLERISKNCGLRCP